MQRFAKVFMLIVWTVLIFGVGVVVGWGGAGQLSSRSAATPNEVRQDFAPFWETWAIINREYFEQPLDSAALVDGAIEGMLEPLGDPNTRYLTPVEQQRDEEDMDGEFQGIGARIEFVQDEGVVIIAPIVGSPAEAAGLRPGDVIQKADGIELPTVEFAVDTIRGEAGKPVLLTILRDGETLEIEVVRGVILVPSVVSEMRDDGLAYIQLTQFGNDTARDFEKALDELLAQSPDGLIVDLRNNPGGLLAAVVSIGDELLAEGVMLSEEFGNGSSRLHRTKNGGAGEEIPLVVLINEGSASASEVLAGAIKIRGRGEIIGVTSFGKGTVQQVLGLSNGGGLRVTIAHWLMPDGSWIHEVGVEPDLVVERGDDFERDLQLEAAVEVLNRKVLEIGE